VRLPAVSAKGTVAPDLGARLDGASDSALISHQEQAARIGIGRSTYFRVKAGRAEARRRGDGRKNTSTVYRKRQNGTESGPFRDCCPAWHTGGSPRRAPRATRDVSAQRQARDRQTQCLAHRKSGSHRGASSGFGRPLDAHAVRMTASAPGALPGGSERSERARRRPDPQARACVWIFQVGSNRFPPRRHCPHATEHGYRRHPRTRDFPRCLPRRARRRASLCRVTAVARVRPQESNGRAASCSQQIGGRLQAPRRLAKLDCGQRALQPRGFTT